MYTNPLYRSMVGEYRPFVHVLSLCRMHYMYLGNAA